MKSRTIIEAADGIALALNRIAESIHALGNNHAATPMGAIEYLGKTLDDRLIEIAIAIGENNPN